MRIEAQRLCAKAERTAAVLRVAVALMRGGVFHADPDDFYRLWYRDVKILCEALEWADSGLNRGPAPTMVRLLVHFLAMLLCLNNRTIYNINLDVFRWMLFWIKYLRRASVGRSRGWGAVGSRPRCLGAPPPHPICVTGKKPSL